MKIYIWGTGKIASEYIQCGEISQEDVIGFVETKRNKETFWDRPVYEPQEIVNTDYDYLIVCVNNFEQEIYYTCKKIGIDTVKDYLRDQRRFAFGIAGGTGISILAIAAVAFTDAIEASACVTFRVPFT